MKQTEYILAINQHPSFPCQIVEKSLWPEKPDSDLVECYLQKLSALQAGSVVEKLPNGVVEDKTLDHTPREVCYHCLNGVHNNCDYASCRCKAKNHDDSEWWVPSDGVYELDPSRWAVEIKWQYWCVNAWIDTPEGQAKHYQNYAKEIDVRTIAIISPVETLKEEDEKCDLTYEEIQRMFNSMPKRDGFSEIKIMPKDFVKEGEPILIMHPNDYEKIKKDAAFGD